MYLSTQRMRIVYSGIIQGSQKQVESILEYLYSLVICGRKYVQSYKNKWKCKLDE